MNKNIIIAFLVGVIITLVVVNYLPKFDIKIEMAKTEPLKIDETQKDDSFLNETTEIVNNTISKNKKIEEKTSKPANELSAKEEKTNPLDKYLPNKDKYKDLENSQYSYSETVELEERTDPFDIPDRPEPIKEPDIPLIDIPQPKRPEMRSESLSTPDFFETVDPDFTVNVSRDPNMKPVVKVPPPYPRRAMERCLEGWGLVEFTVTETGAVINPRIIDADPPGIFNRSILRTIVKWKYKPTISKGKAVQVTGIQHLLVYELNDNYQIKCMENMIKK
jgi:protein TonB